MWKLFAIVAGIAAFAGTNAPVNAARAPRCDAKRAVATTIDTIQADYASWRGKCVKLRGIAFEWRLYADRWALAEPSLEIWKGRAHTIVIRRHNGLPSDRIPRSIEIVGMVGSCADENDALDAIRAQTNDLVMLSGYCHTSLENYVRPTSIHVIDDRPIPRLTEAELPMERREIVRAPANLKGLLEGQTEARRMLRMLHDGDEDDYVRASEPALAGDLDKAKSVGKPAWLRKRLASSHADYMRLKRGLGPDLMRLSSDAAITTFIARDELSADDNFTPQLIHCWCKGSDCEGRWPVLSIDADNLRERPFLCVATNGWLLGLEHRTVIQSRVPLADAGFAEPPAN